MRLRTIAVATVMMFSASACAFSGLAFRQDDRVRIQVPKARSSVSLPVKISWTAENLPATAAYFGVFVDRIPPRPGQDLAHLFRRDRTCRNIAGCPDPAYLADHGIFRTTDRSVVVPVLPATDINGSPRTGPARSSWELHEVTIVLLDADEVRIGEAAWAVTFFFDRAI